MTKELIAQLRRIGDVDEGGEPSIELLAAAVLNEQAGEIERLQRIEAAAYDALQAQIERLTAELTQAREGRWPQIVEVLNGHLAEIERLRAELAAAPRVMIHEHWNAPHVDDELTHPSAHPSTPWEVP